jgi:hypothetical protein
MKFPDVTPSACTLADTPSILVGLAQSLAVRTFIPLVIHLHKTKFKSEIVDLLETSFFLIVWCFYKLFFRLFCSLKVGAPLVSTG